MPLSTPAVKGGVPALRDAARAPELFAELAEKYPGRPQSDDLLKNCLIRRGFAPNAISQVISAYRETSDMVERESAGYDAAPVKQEEPAMTQPFSTQPLARVSAAAPPILAEVALNERSLGRYDFEEGAYVRIAAFGDVDTEAALDMVETMVQLKRAELARRKKSLNVRTGQSDGEGKDEIDE